MRVLVLGGGRFQGLRAAQLLVASGHAVTVVNRAPVAPEGVRKITGDLDNVALLTETFRGSGYDAVIDNVAYEPAHLVRLRPFLKAAAGHYVLISSLVVYDLLGAGPYRPVSEAEADLTDERGSGYDLGKRQSEALLRTFDDLHWSVLRLAQVEGPGDPSNRRGFFIDRVADGGGLLLPSDVSHPYQPVWRDDAATAAVKVAGNRAAFGRTYNVAGSEVFTPWEWLCLLADTLGVSRPPVVQLPMAELRLFAGFEYRAPLPFRPLLDNTALRGEMGWEPTPAGVWLPDTIAWWRSSGLTSRFWEHRAQEVAAIRRVLGLKSGGGQDFQF